MFEVTEERKEAKLVVEKLAKRDAALKKVEHEANGDHQGRHLDGLTARRYLGDGPETGETTLLRHSWWRTSAGTGETQPVSALEHAFPSPRLIYI